MIYRLLAVAVISFGLSLTPLRADARVFSPETFTLKNGMQVVVIPNHRVPVVTQMVWYKVGAADEGPGESGIAHFLEHLMFKGTPKHPDGEFSALVAKNGGQENAFTTSDYTAFFQTVAKDRLPLVMDLESDRMTHLVLSKQDIETERQVIIEERRMRVENSPAARLGEQTAAVLYFNHPYGRPTIGWHHEMEELDRKRVIAFYHKWYAPNNAILVVAGDITAKELKPLAEKYYGVIPAHKVPERHWLKEPPHEAARMIVMHDPQVRQPSWQRTYDAPSVMHGDTEYADPLEVMTQVLGGGTTSRLYRSLVVGQKLAVAAGAYYRDDRRGPGQLVVYASPAPGVSLDKLQAAVDEEIAKMKKSGITDDELKRAVDNMKAGAIFARDSISAAARTLGQALAIGETIDDVESWPDRIAAVTRAQVKAAADHVFDVRHSVTSRLLPEGDE